jgi:hypothetical protein
VAAVLVAKVTGGRAEAIAGVTAQHPQPLPQ